MWHDGGVDNLGTLPGDLYSLAFDLNNRGTVVGWSYTSFEAPHAFMWRNGYMTPLGALPGSSASCAYRISENGWVAGLSDSTDGRYHAVLWRLPPQ